jgi:hypothetical protein
VQALAAANGALFVGGAFTSVGGTPAANIARLAGTTWSALGTGTNGEVSALAAFGSSGQIVAGGSFTQAGGIAASRLARWDGAAWSPLGSGVDGPVRALAAQGGQLWVGGAFATAGGGSSPGLARWNSATASWSAVGVSGGLATVDALLVLRNGDVVAAGDFTAIAGVPAANIARWNGATWSPLFTGSNGRVLALTQLPDGDLVIGGTFTQVGGQTAINLARWSGSLWSGLGLPPNGPVFAVAWLGRGRLAIGGSFTRLGPFVRPGLGILTTSCQALAENASPPCPASTGLSPGGTGLTDPWLGADFVCWSPNLPPSSLVATLFGTAAGPLPLSQLLPFAGPSCFLFLPAPIVVQLALPVAGEVFWTLPIPDQSALIGLPFWTQNVVLELNAAQQFTAASNSGAVRAVIGDF